MLWFTSDNDPETFTPGVTEFRGRKRSLYEGGVRVPGLIEWPAMITENHKTAFPVVSSDLLPTACDIVNTTIPKDRPIDSVPILPLIKGKATLRNASMKWAYDRNENFPNGYFQAALSDDQYKLHAEYSGGEMSRTELYDLTKDPYERDDIKDQMKTVHDKMVDKLDEWYQSVENSARNVVKCHWKLLNRAQSYKI